MSGRKFAVKLKYCLYYAAIFSLIGGSVYLLYFLSIEDYTAAEIQRFWRYFLYYGLTQPLLWLVPLAFVFSVLWLFYHALDELLVAGLSALLVFLPLVYWINKRFLPGFLEPVSIAGNIFLAAAALAFALFLKKAFQGSKPFETFYSPFLFGIAVVILAGTAVIYQTQPDHRRLEPAPKTLQPAFLSYFKSEFTNHGANHDRPSDSSNLLRLFRSIESRAPLVNAELLKFLKNNYLDSAKVVKQADDILARKFTFWGRTEQLDADIQWYQSPNEDLVWIYALNELEWLRSLSGAYLYTKDEKYARDFVRIMESWFRQIKFPRWKNEKDPVWRLIGAGMRMSDGMIHAFYAFWDSPHFYRDLKIKILASIHDHAQFLAHFRSPRRNHIIQETYGLLKAALLFPEFKQASFWLEVANERLDRAMTLDVYPDGGYVEASTFYHYYVILLFQRIFDFAQHYKYDLGSKYAATLENMYQFLLYLSRPDGQFPQVNDGFHGRALYHLFEKAAAIFNRSDFEYYATRRQKGSPPEVTSVELPYSGFYVMRSGWDPQANYCFFDAGWFGSAHGHEDKLNIEIFALGQPFIVDPGTYTYVYNKWHQFFESSFAHNTVVIDGKGQYRGHRKDKWDSWPHRRLPVIWVSKDRYDYAEATYDDGYGLTKENIDDGFKHTRRILFVKPDYWVVWDFIEGKGKHKVEQLFHFMPIPIQTKHENIVYARNRDAALVLWPLFGEGLELNIVEGRENPVQGWYAPKYGEKVPAPTAIFSKKIDFPTSFVTVIVPIKTGFEQADIEVNEQTVSIGGRPLSPNQAVAFTLKIRDRHDLVLLAPGMKGSKKVADYQTDNEILILKLDKNQEIVERVDERLETAH